MKKFLVCLIKKALILSAIGAVAHVAYFAYTGKDPKDARCPAKGCCKKD
jgi:hypothetical protein